MSALLALAAFQNPHRLSPRWGFRLLGDLFFSYQSSILIPGSWTTTWSVQILVLPELRIVDHRSIIARTAGVTAAVSVVNGVTTADAKARAPKPAPPLLHRPSLALARLVFCQASLWAICSSRISRTVNGTITRPLLRKNAPISVIASLE